MTLWIAIVAVALVSFTIKAAGPALLTGRELPPWAAAIIPLLAPALLAGLVVVEVLGWHWSGVNRPVLAGIAAVVVAHLLRAPMLVAVLVGIVVTAAARAVLG